MADQTPTLGEIIRRQRELTELSMRKFAAPRRRHRTRSGAPTPDTRP